jgi:hypothetical protein
MSFSGTNENKVNWHSKIRLVSKDLRGRSYLSPFQFIYLCFFTLFLGYVSI